MKIEIHCDLIDAREMISLLNDAAKASDRRMDRSGTRLLDMLSAKFQQAVKKEG